MTKPDQAYRNVIVCREEDLDAQTYQKIVELFQSDDVADHISKVINKSAIPAWD